jgi:hypothetical protein
MFASIYSDIRQIPVCSKTTIVPLTGLGNGKIALAASFDPVLMDNYTLNRWFKNDGPCFFRQ